MIPAISFSFDLGSGIFFWAPVSTIVLHFPFYCCIMSNWTYCTFSKINSLRSAFNTQRKRSRKKELERNKRIAQNLYYPSRCFHGVHKKNCFLLPLKCTSIFIHTISVKLLPLCDKNNLRVWLMHIGSYSSIYD